MAGIGPLPASLREQPGRDQPAEHHPQQLISPVAFGQPGPELAEHRAAEPRVLQLQAQRILPVDPGVDRVRTRAVGGVLGELQHRHQRQLPR
jgi:hypothetical protein